MTELIDNNALFGDAPDGISSPELDALFSSARDAQPDLQDENFSKVLMNTLPSKPVRRRRNPGISFDVIGIILGLVAVYWFFDASRFVTGILNFVPESITLSPLHAVVALGSISVMSVLAWWTVENNRS